MNPIYKFSIIINDVEKQVYPNYKDDLSKDYRLESSQRFYRAELSGKLTFQNKDYDYINNSPFETEFVFLIYKSDDNGITWSEYWKGKFMKTDCKFNEDNRSLEVQPEILDDYVDVLAGLDKEYNLIKLAPQISPIIIERRPLIQIYIPGDTVVSCFIGGEHWEQDANAVDDRQALVKTHHFALCNLLKEIKITVNGTPDASGLYVGRMNTTDNGNTFSGKMHAQNITDYYLYINQVRIFFGWGGCTYQLCRTSDDVVLFEYSQTSAPDNMDFTMTSKNGATGTALAEMATYPIYARYLLDVDTINGLATYDIPISDVVEDNRNYKKAIGYALDVAYISTNSSVDPTEYGLRDDGTYFMPPYSIYNQPFYPIAKSKWRYSSIWFGFYLMDQYIEKEGRKAYQIKDNYPISSVISVLLKQFAPDIIHDGTAEYSQFLYGDTNPITYGKFKLYIAQKSNVIFGDYDRPAQKAPITINDIFKMLRDCYKCYFYIEDKKLKIEHIKFFRNGGSYSPSQQVAVDLTTETNINNMKKWGYLTSQYEFDKLEMPERYQFEWADTVTKSFEGYPIEMISKYVTAGKIEDVSISKFTSDIDYMILNPGDISSDGFALFTAVTADALFDSDAGSYLNYGHAESGAYGDKKYRLKTVLNGKQGKLIGSLTSSTGATLFISFFDASGNIIVDENETTIGIGTTALTVYPTIPTNAYYIGFHSYTGSFDYQIYSMEVQGNWELPFINRTIDNTDFSIQNGLASFIYLIPNFYVYDLPAKHVKINDESATAIGIDRKKKQSVKFPSNTDIDPVKLIKTSLGFASIDKISVNLHSRMNKIDLRYDTEQ